MRCFTFLNMKFAHKVSGRWTKSDGLRTLQRRAEKAQLAAGFSRVYKFRPVYIYLWSRARKPNLS
jgi:hypothetical protein